MTESTADTAAQESIDPTDIDPERLFEDGRVETDTRTYTHETADHCEAGTAGRAIVGLTDEAGRVLLAVDRTEKHVILPNAKVAPGEDWAAVGRERVEGLAGVEVTVDGVERVRRVEHVLEDDLDSTAGEPTYHVVFGASLASAGQLDDLCADNDWELGWYEALPFPVEDDDRGVLDDLRLFLD